MCKTVTWLLLFVALQTACAQPAGDTTGIKVMTWNIRYDDGSEGAFSWTNRGAQVVKLVTDEAPDLIGMQEVLHTQLNSLLPALSKYAWFGVGRDDGSTAGEYSPVFYNAGKFRILDSGFFWLSATPHVAKPGWNASCIRIVTWVKLKDVRTGNMFFFFNTHFDHVGHRARRNSAILLLRKISEICGATDVIVTGDFNFSSRNIVYRRMTNLLNGLADTKNLSESGHAGPAGSFIGFPYQTRKHSDIDMIFIRRGSARVFNHTTLDYNNTAAYPSDHLPVITTLVFTR